jgi:hypothetical protein
VNSPVAPSLVSYDDDVEGKGAECPADAGGARGARENEVSKINVGRYGNGATYVCEVSDRRGTSGGAA